MYTLIRNSDGTITMRTHVSPTALPPERARGLLRALEPILGELEKIADGEGTRGAGSPDQIVGLDPGVHAQPGRLGPPGHVRPRALQGEPRPTGAGAPPGALPAPP